MCLGSFGGENILEPNSSRNGGVLQDVIEVNMRGKRKKRSKRNVAGEEEVGTGANTLPAMGQAE